MRRNTSSVSHALDSFPSRGSLYETKRKGRKFYQNYLPFLVAGEGLEPTTSGLSLRAALRCPEFPRRRGGRLEIPTAAEKALPLHPPPAARQRFSQRAPLAGLITRSPQNQPFLQLLKKQPAKRRTAFQCLECPKKIFSISAFSRLLFYKK